MVKIKSKAYTPNATAKKTYDRLFAIYRELHDAFGGVNRKSDLSRVMKDLLAISKSSIS
jgi:L-ribulokinase